MKTKNKSFLEYDIDEKKDVYKTYYKGKLIFSMEKGKMIEFRCIICGKFPSIEEHDLISLCSDCLPIMEQWFEIHNKWKKLYKIK